MNAFLRTGPQMLSPEPACTAPTLIPAPGAAAVPAQGLMAVAGRGGAGVYGMVNAYLRTGAQMLSPEPGCQQAGIPAQGPQAVGMPGGPIRRPPAAQLSHLSHLYSPASPLADTPQAAPTAWQGCPGGVMPSSVCSNAESSSSSAAAAASISLGRQAIPQLQLGCIPHGTQQREAGRDSEITLAPAGGSVCEELPTARLSPACGVLLQARGPSHRPPSPISFCLPGDSPAMAAAAPPPDAASPGGHDGPCESQLP